MFSCYICVYSTPRRPALTLSSLSINTDVTSNEANVPIKAALCDESARRPGECDAGAHRRGNGRASRGRGTTSHHDQGDRRTRGGRTTDSVSPFSRRTGDVPGLLRALGGATSAAGSFNLEHHV